MPVVAGTRAWMRAVATEHDIVAADAVATDMEVAIRVFAGSVWARCG
ncbi:MAG: hypothetical protein WBO57_05295 [Gammaproteobacteria bacterium]